MTGRAPRVRPSASESRPHRLAGFERSPLATWVTVFDPFRVTWANPAGIELWSARDLDELRARDFSSSSEASTRQARAWLDAFRAGTRDLVTLEWTLYPRGVPRRVRLFVSGIELDDGEWGLLQQAVPADSANDPDILRGAEAVRHTSMAVASISPSGEVLSRNPALIEAFGLDTPPSRWFEEPSAHADILAVARHGQIHRAGLSSRRSGALRHYAVEARKTIDPVTGEGSILVHMLDETARLGAELDAERKGRLVAELERALAIVEDQKQRWQALVDSAPDVVMIVDRERRIELANRPLGAARQDAAALAGVDIATLFEPGSREDLAAAIELAFATQAIQAVEVEASGAKGPRRYSVRLGPIGADGPVERLTLIASDVTQHRAIEHQLRHSQKMLAVGTLAGGVAHDFNNLLTVIIGSCELATLSAELGRDVRPQLDEIAAAAERASTLTRQLLAFGRKQILQPKRVDLCALVRELSKLLVRVIGERISLVLELGERPCFVLADPGQLEQVIMNLVVNACDAMAEGGTLTLTVDWADPAGDELLLAVADTGEGIDPDLQARIFEPFFTTKEIGKGTGLGLAMVHGIVEQSGGSVGVRSELGVGTRFEVRLPRV